MLPSRMRFSHVHHFRRVAWRRQKHDRAKPRSANEGRLSQGGFHGAGRAFSRRARAGFDVGPAGYVALYRVAADNLQLGNAVVADTVNPIEITRAAFRAVAAEANTGFVEIEVVCSDPETHRHRAETRPPTVEGLIPPTWAEISVLHYEPWEHPHLRIDTAVSTVEDSVARIMALL